MSKFDEAVSKAMGLIMIDDPVWAMKHAVRSATEDVDIDGTESATITTRWVTEYITFMATDVVVDAR